MRSGAGFRGRRPAGGDTLRQRDAVRLDGSRRAFRAVGVVAEARHRAALHSAVLPAGQRSARAHASYAEGRDVEAGGAVGRRAAAALRLVPPTLQRGPAARGARTEGRRRGCGGHQRAPLPAGRLEDPWYDADHEVRRVRPGGQIKWRGEEIFIGEAFAGELVGLAEHDSGGHIVRFCAPRSRGDRPRPPLPALCSAACAAPRRSGSGGDSGTMSEYCQGSARSEVSGINPVGPGETPTPTLSPQAGEGAQSFCGCRNSTQEKGE